ncbi:unnamed protein product [Alopecurus aequalis]
MHPAGAVAAAGGAVMKWRAAARANIILGMAMAAMGIVAATINPGNFYAQTIEYAAPAPAPGAQQCAATEAEALGVRGAALLLVLMGVVQAVAAAAASVAVAGSLRMLGRWLAASAYVFAAINAGTLCYVVHGAVVVARGHCADGYIANLAICYVYVAGSYAALLGVSLAVTFF